MNKFLVTMDAKLVLLNRRFILMQFLGQRFAEGVSMASRTKVDEITSN